ncbi:MAG TPA: nicotinamide riboside transporter PnuC [Terracidiphilus sp.]|nr:nicotinamide riboside transporter PnuC [Terracidiphilus sp.]
MILSAVGHYLAANWVELAGFITTAVGIWLTTKRLLISWPIILAADVFYLVVFYRARLLSDALLQIFFIVFTLYGWWNWWRGVREEGEVRVVPLALPSMLIAVAAGIAGSFVVGEITKRLNAALPYLDAALMSFSLVGSWWQARKHIAAWWLWIVVDLLYIYEYISKDLWLTAVLYAVLVFLAVLGLRDWSRAERAAQTAACTTLRSGSPAM